MAGNGGFLREKNKRIFENGSIITVMTQDIARVQCAPQPVNNNDRGVSFSSRRCPTLFRYSSISVRMEFFSSLLLEIK